MFDCLVLDLILFVVAIGCVIDILLWKEGMLMIVIMCDFNCEIRGREWSH